jgi:uncharacterized protein with GYD domain
MTSYLLLGKYSTIGLEGLLADGGTKTEKAARDLFAAYGGKVSQFAFCVGEYDFAIWGELPDEAAISALKLAVKSMGHVELQSVRLLGAKEVDSIARAAKQGGKTAPAAPAPKAKAKTPKPKAKTKPSKAKKPSKS